MSLCDRSHGGLRGRRSEVDQSLVVGPRPRARPYVVGTMSRYGPIAQRRASPNVNMHWRWIEISPPPIPLSDLVRFSSATPKRQRPHCSRPLRLSPRDTIDLHLDDLRGRGETPPRQLGAGGCVVSAVDRGQSKLAAFTFSCWPPPSRSLVDWTKRVPPSRPASRSTRPSPLPRPRRLDGDERRPDIPGRTRAHFRRHAKGRSPRTIIAAPRGGADARVRQERYDSELCRQQILSIAISCGNQKY